MSRALSMASVPGVCRGFEKQTQRRCPLMPRPSLTGLLTAAAQFSADASLTFSFFPEPLPALLLYTCPLISGYNTAPSFSPPPACSGFSFPHMASAFFEAGFVLRKAMPGYRLVGWLVCCSFHWEKAAIWDTVGGLLEGAETRGFLRQVSVSRALPALVDTGHCNSTYIATLG